MNGFLEPKNGKVDFDWKHKQTCDLIKSLDWTNCNSFTTLYRMIDDLDKYHKERVKDLLKQLQEQQK